MKIKQIFKNFIKVGRKFAENMRQTMKIVKNSRLINNKISNNY